MMPSWPVEGAPGGLHGWGQCGVVHVACAWGSSVPTQYPPTLGVFIFGFRAFSRKVYDKVPCLVVVSVGFEWPVLAVGMCGVVAL